MSPIDLGSNHVKRISEYRYVEKLKMDLVPDLVSFDRGRVGLGHVSHCSKVSCQLLQRGWLWFRLFCHLELYAVIITYQSL